MKFVFKASQLRAGTSALQKRQHFLLPLILCIFLAACPAYCSTYYVATNGSDSNAGTITAPFLTIGKGVTKAVAGDTIYVRGGTYTYTGSSTAITLAAKSGASDANRPKLFAYPNERPLVNFSGMSGTGSDGISVKGSYWYIKGLDLKGAPHNGLRIRGDSGGANYNIIEFCSSYENRNSGVQIDKGAAYNQIINCDSYHNCDVCNVPVGKDADGFSPKLDVGTNNYFYGCRSWGNSDDGYDGYLRPSDDVNTTYENCWAFKNGWYWLDGSTNEKMNGNGFKMGGSDDTTLRHNATVKNCLAFHNKVKGFDQNNDRGNMTLYNCTAFDNNTTNDPNEKGANYGINVFPLASGKTATVINCASYGTTAGGAIIDLNSAVVQTTNSWNPPFVVTGADFASIDANAAYGPRKADGSLPDINFMHLAAGSDLIDGGTDVNLPYNGSAPDLGCFESNSTGGTEHRSLLISASAGGTVTTPGIGTYSYDVNTDANIAATVVDANYHFVNWTGTAVTAGKVANPNALSTTVLMDANYTVQANFDFNQRALTTSVTGSGTVTTPGIGTYWYNQGTDANIAASASANYHFVNWTGTAVTAGKVASPTSATTTVTMDANYTVTANFAIDQKSLLTSAIGSGTVTTPGIGTYWYDYNTPASIVASASANYHFVNWTGTAVTAGKVASPTSATTTVTMDANYTVQANFTIDQKSLTTSASSGGTVTTPGIGTYWYDYNTPASIVASASANYHFVNWTGTAVTAGKVASPTSATTTVTMDADYTVQANFTIDTFTLDYTAGDGGSLTGDADQVVDYNTNGTEVTAVADLGYHFVKWSDDVTANPRTDLNVTANINVTATFAIDQMTISGYVTEPDANIPVTGVAVDANNGGGSDTTDANGYYELTVDYGWSGTVTPSKTGYTFEPNGTEYSNVTTDHNDNYTAILDTFIISGYAVDSAFAPLAGVLAAPDNNGGSYTSKYHGGGSDTTDANGYYEVLVDYNWSGNVVLSKYAYTFEPNSIAYANVTANIADQNYVGTLLAYKITGYIKNSCEVPIKSVQMDANNGGGSDTTDVNGYYEVWVGYNWSGDVTLSKAHYTFDPNGRAYTDVLENQTGQDYAATNIYDLDCSGYIGFGDVKIIGDNWLGSGLGDFNGDDNVNFLDFAEFAEVWLEE